MQTAQEKPRGMGHSLLSAALMAGLLVFVVQMALDVSVVFAQNQWEEPLKDIATSVMGPVALAGFLIALGVGCLAAMAGMGGYGFLVGAVIFGAILGNADTFAGWLGIGE